MAPRLLYVFNVFFPFSSDDEELEAKPIIMTPKEIMDQLSSYRSRIFNDYISNQRCDRPEFEALHTHLFFHSAHRVTDKIPVRLSTAVNDIIK